MLVDGCSSHSRGYRNRDRRWASWGVGLGAGEEKIPGTPEAARVSFVSSMRTTILRALRIFSIWVFCRMTCFVAYDGKQLTER
jgi:hypothetical protein